jgi:ketoreductase RED2
VISGAIARDALPMARKLEGKVAIVTGSASGIGEATARALDAQGASVVVNSVRSVDAGNAVASQLASACYIQADIAEEEDARRLVSAAVERFGHLDILVNNAGTTVKIPHQDLDAVTGDVWREILSVNVIGTWNVTVAAVPHLRESGDGCVVTVSSLAGLRPVGSSIPYAVSKAAVNHLTLLLANVLGPEIRVNAVAPGLVDTPWTAEWEVERASVRKRAPLARSATPDDVAQVVLGFVNSPYQTGDIALVDGGLHLR